MHIMNVMFVIVNFFSKNVMLSFHFSDMIIYFILDIARYQYDKILKHASIVERN